MTIGLYRFQEFRIYGGPYPQPNSYIKKDKVCYGPTVRVTYDVIQQSLEYYNGKFQDKTEVSPNN